MTDPRIEAAAWMIGSVSDLAPGGDWEKLTLYQKTHFRRLAKAVMESADDAAWRPIETAPKDGSYVDLWVINEDEKGRRIADAYFGPIPHTCGEYGQYCDSFPEEGNFWIDGIFGHEIYGDITHWQPLPSPPVVDVGGGNGCN